jgi:hypothetical protein
MEQNLELLGATGVEDKLQAGVYETMVALRHAGCCIWVLTGLPFQPGFCFCLLILFFTKGTSARQLSTLAGRLATLPLAWWLAL